MRPLVGAIVVMLALAGCGDDGTGRAGATSVRAATIAAGDALPPATDPVLHVERAGGSVDLDLATIESLELLETTVYEPLQQTDLAFRGVWMVDLLALIGEPDPPTVRMHALDDYQVEFAGSDLLAGDALLATADGNGDPIPVDEGGPIRLVFLDPDGPGANAARWIWSIDALVVG